MKRFKWDKKYLYWGITAFLVIICCLVFFMALNRWNYIAQFLSNIFNILKPVVYGLIFAYLLTPLVKMLETKLMGRLFERLFPKDQRKVRSYARVSGMLIAFIVALFLIVVLLTLLLPELYKSLEALVSRLPGYFNTAIDFIRETLNSLPEIEVYAVSILDDLGDYFTDWIQTTLLSNINTLISSVSSGVFGFITVLSNLFIGIIFSVYIIYNRELFAAQFKKIMFSLMSEKHVSSVISSLHYIDRSFGGFIIGKLLDSAIIGGTCFIFLSLVNMPYTVLVSVVVGITNLIPFFGPFIGGIPSAFLILMESPVKCLVFVVFLIILQQIDGNIIGPKILSNTTGLSGFWVMFSIIAGGGLFGVWGMLCGVPVFSIIYGAGKFVISKLLKKKNLPLDTVNYFDTGPVEEEARSPNDKDSSEKS